MTHDFMDTYYAAIEHNPPLPGLTETWAVFKRVGTFGSKVEVRCANEQAAHFIADHMNKTTPTLPPEAF